MREVMSSAAEAELGALFHNGKEACPIRTALEEMGHPQPPTPIQTNNSTTAGIVTDSVKQKCSKAIDMRFTGSATVFARANTTFIGAKAPSTALTILPSTIQPNTIAPFDPRIFIAPTVTIKTISTASKKPTHLNSSSSPLAQIIRSANGGEGVLISGFPNPEVSLTTIH